MKTNHSMTSQDRFAMASYAAWSVLRNPVLTRVFQQQWESIYPRPTALDGHELTLYGYVFYVMYHAV